MTLRSLTRWTFAISCAVLTGIALAYCWDRWQRPTTFVAMAAGLVIAVWVVGQIVEDERQRRRDSDASLRYLRKRGGGL